MSPVAKSETERLERIDNTRDDSVHPEKCITGKNAISTRCPVSEVEIRSLRSENIQG